MKVIKKLLFIYKRTDNCTLAILYICLWLFKYTKTSAVFFYFTLTFSLEMSDEP